MVSLGPCGPNPFIIVLQCWLQLGALVRLHLDTFAEANLLLSLLQPNVLDFLTACALYAARALADVSQLVVDIL
eukprot:1140333-Pelagomonas_calceolata.AAC.5